MYFNTKVLKYQQIQYFFSTKIVASETNIYQMQQPTTWLL